jgi:hypothetical protein
MVVSLYSSEKEANQKYLMEQGVILSQAKPKMIRQKNHEYLAGKNFGATINLQDQLD